MASGFASSGPFKSPFCDFDGEHIPLKKNIVMGISNELAVARISTQQLPDVQVVKVLDD
jgi:hypothetical protein